MFFFNGKVQMFVLTLIVIVGLMGILMDTALMQLRVLIVGLFTKCLVRLYREKLNPLTTEQFLFQMEVKKALENLRALQGIGYEVDEKQLELLKDLDRRNRKVLQVFSCKTCRTEFEQFVKVLNVSHSCGKQGQTKQRLLQKIWEA